MSSSDWDETSITMVLRLTLKGVLKVQFSLISSLM